MGHASFLIELPAPKGEERGLTLLLDPAYSQRCGPFQFVGPAPRYTRGLTIVARVLLIETEPPCSVSELPDIDAIVSAYSATGLTHADHLSQPLRSP